MSWDSKRQEIADTLSTIDGVKGYKFRPDSPKPGDGWPRFGGMTREDGWMVVTWNVMVFLPQNEAKASEWMDNHLEALIEGLLPTGFVESVEPANIAVGEATQYGLLVTFRSE